MQTRSQPSILIVAAVASICVASCNQKTELPSPANADPATCHARGGHIRKVGIKKDTACVVKFRDAGKACRDTSDCEGECVAPYRNDLQEGSPGTGRCQPDDYMDGVACWTEIVDGRTRGGWCRD